MENFQIPRNLGGTEHVQTFFSAHALEPGNEARPLSEVNSTTVHDLTVLYVSSLPLSVMVHSHIQ